MDSASSAWIDAAPEPVQVLGADGSVRDDHGLTLGLEHLDLDRLYRDLVLSRRLDTTGITLQRQGELGLWPSMLGQEGAQVGAAHAARNQDMLFPTYRDHAVAWVRGVEPAALLAVFRGCSLGGWAPTGNLGMYTLVIGAQTLHAVGYAMGVVRDGLVGTGEQDRDTAVLVFLGDGALSEGETNEALAWAGAQALPVVFFCENNQWAISSPVATQSRVPLARRAHGFGFDGIRVDGNDVLACRAVTRAALDQARAGGGPTLIEAYTYRLGAHTTSDDDTRYRARADLDLWRERDPIDRLRRYLQAHDTAADFFDAVEAEADALAERMRTECRQLPPPDPDGPFRHCYADPPPELERQRAEHRELAATSADAEAAR